MIYFIIYFVFSIINYIGLSVAASIIKIYYENEPFSNKYMIGSLFK